MLQVDADLWDTVKKRVIQLLKQAEDQSIPVSSFFNVYKHLYKDLPDPSSFNVDKRSDILKLFDDICDVEDGLVSLKQAESQDIGAAVRILGEQLAEILLDKPSGCQKKELWSCYRNKFGTKPDPSEFGCRTLHEILLLTDVVEHVKIDKSASYRLKTTTTRRGVANHTSNTIERAPSPANHGPATIKGELFGRASSPRIQDIISSRRSPSPHSNGDLMKRTRWETLMPPGTEQGLMPLGTQQGLMPPGTYHNGMPQGGLLQTPPGAVPNIMEFPQLSRNMPPAPPPQRAPRQQASGPSWRQEAQQTQNQGYEQSYHRGHGDRRHDDRQRYDDRPRYDDRQRHDDRQRYDDRQRHDSGGRGGPPTKKLFISKDQLENVAKDCIERLAETKKYVSVERIEKLLLQHFSVSHLSEINVKQLEHIACVNELVRTQAKVNAYIQGFMKTRAIATLHELGEALKMFVAGSKDFETLHLGPLVEQPMVYYLFKFPPEGVDVPEIETADILESLRQYLTEKDLWTTKGDLTDFMTYMMEKRGLDSPYELGVRITSIALAIQVLKRAQRDSGQAVRSAIIQLREMAEGDLTKAFDNFVRSVVSKEPGFCVVRQEYSRMPPKQLLDVLFQKINVLYSSVNYLQELHQVGRGQIREVARTHAAIHGFLGRLQQDQVLQKLFQFAICCSSEEIHLQLNDILGLGAGSSQATPSGPGDGDTNKPRPTMYDLLQLIRKYVERCLVHGGLSIANLARIENKLLEEFDFPHFHSLGHGTFMDLMAQNPEMKKFLEDFGCGSLGLSLGGGGGKTSYQPSLHDLLYFVWQSGVQDPSQLLPLEDALCHHYCSADVRSLGHGSATHLLQNLQRNPSQGRDSCVLFEGALIAKANNPCVARGRQVGVLGHQAKDRALACLQSCPLLEDLSEWSHWNIVFGPEHGDIRDFIQKYGNLHTMNILDQGEKVQMTTSILALETKPGTMLRIAAETSPDKMAAAALAGDVQGTCGHLVSLIVTNKGLENTGLVLLGNHVKTAIIKMQADQIPGGPSDGASISAKFVLDCLTLLPKLLCVSIAQKVFLEPLSQIVGQTKSRDLLLKHATCSVTRGRLQLLGLMLGLEDWSQSFMKRTEPPRDCLQKLDPLVIDDVIMIGDDDDESSDSDSPDSDIELILSDVEPEIKSGKEIFRILSLSEARSDSDAPQTISDSNTEQEVTELEVETAEKDISAITVDSSAGPSSPRDGDDTVMVLGGEDMDGTSSGDDTDLVSGDEVTMEIDPCQRVVEEIRRDEFGVDVVLSEDGQKLMVKQQERLGRSLERLSRDLYSKDTHFVLELIQNADDNNYPQDMDSDDQSACPSVRFIVDDQAISVLNNECGFQEPNIRALCDVGRSTKGKHTYGYIGQKGIGFKSVFRITDRPEIHSNGYHMCFDVNSGPTGYILPHWIGGEAPTDQTDPGWTTRIVLPLKQQAGSQTQSLAARFHDVHPSLLLFLHRLKSLSVVNKVEDYTLNIRRHDLGDKIIEIRHSKATDRWFVVRTRLDAAKISLQAKSGVDVGSTEIAMAFPLQSRENVLGQIQPQKQPVFAYLPLRSYGFRFVVQGDFDVPSSREDVDRDSLWNQWLRSELHLLFVQALQEFKDHPEFSELDAVCRFLQFVPLEDEILDFFRPVATQILKHLRASPCLPAAAIGKRLTWKLPSQLIMSRDHLLQEVIPSSVLRDHLSLDYLHPDVAAILNPTLMSSLGVQKMSMTHLIEIRKAMIIQQEKQEVIDVKARVLNTAKWLTCVYRAMDEFENNGDILEQLRKLPTIPLVGGMMISLAEKSVFFPPEADQQPKRRNLLLALYEDLNSVNPLLLHGQGSVANSQVTNLLERLGVKRLTPHDIIHHHILPVLKTDQWQTKSRDLLVAYIVYIKDQFDRNSSILNLDELRSIAVVLTNHGPKKPSESPVHFTPAYNNRVDLPRCLPGYDWTLIDACYMGGSQSMAQVNVWRDFFSKLGVIDFLAMKTEKVSLTPKELAESPWSSDTRPVSEPEVYVLNDRRSEELESLICANKQPDSHLDQMKSLFEILDQLWETQYSGECCVAALCDGDGHTLRQVDTSFCLILKTLPWVPAMVTKTGGEDHNISTDHQVMVASMLFKQDPHIERLLSNHVPYLHAKVSPHSKFAEFLGVKFEVNIDYVQRLLVSWCDRKDAANDDARTFTTSMSHIKAVYKYLYENLTPRDLQDVTHQYPMIFVPQDLGRDQHIPTKGRFLGRHEVRWADPSRLFAKHRSSLEGLDHEGIIRKPELASLYADMKDLFIKGMRVEKKPSLEDYTRLMLHIAGTTTGTRDVPDILKILSLLGQAMIDANQEGENSGASDLEIRNIKLLMGDKKCLPEKHRHRWISLDDKPMLADNPQFERMFKDRSTVNFLECGDKMGGNKMKKQSPDQVAIIPDAVRALYQGLGVEPFSKCLEVTPVTELYAPCPKLQKYVHDVIGYVQRLLVADYDEVYAKLEASDIGSKLVSMTFGQVGKLEQVYNLSNLPDELPVIQKENSLINIEDRQFIVHQNHVESYSDINKELARYFSQGDQHCFRQLKEMLGDLSGHLKHHDTDLQDFVDRHDIQSLPDGESTWTVPEPIIYLPPPPPPPPPMYMQEPMVVPEGSSQSTPATPESDAPSGGITAWPPNASMMALKNKGRPGASQKSTMWPPPKPPADMDRSQLPANLRPSRYQNDGDRSHDPDRPPGDFERQVSSGSRSEGDNIPRSGGHHPDNQPRSGGHGDNQSRSGGHHGDNQQRSEGHQGEGDRRPSGQGVLKVTCDDGEERVEGGDEGAEGAEGAGDVEMVDVTVKTADADEDEDDDDLQIIDDADISGMRPGSEAMNDTMDPVVIEFAGETPGSDRIQHLRKRPRVDSGSRQDGQYNSEQYTKKPVFFYGPPIWTDEADDNMYEEIAEGSDLKLPEDIELDEASQHKDIGDWGEELVKNYLEKLAAEPDSGIIDITWINEEVERGLPYDFVIKTINPDDTETTQDVFIEVKSTVSSKKAFFPISSQQFQFARDLRERFHLYRVFSAGRNQVRLTKLENLSAKMDTKLVKLCMVV